MGRLPWLEDDFPDQLAMSLLAMAGVDVEKRNRLEKRMVEAALHRCGFHTECREAFPRELGKMETDLVNERGERLSLDEKSRLADVYLEVKAEYAQRFKEEKEARERARLAEEARRKAEYDATAAPYREERRRRKAEAWAKRQPK